MPRAFRGGGDPLPPEVAARLTIGEAFVVQTKEVQHRGMEIVQMHLASDAGATWGRCDLGSDV